MACAGFGFLALWLIFLFIYLLLSSRIIFLSIAPHVNYIPIALDIFFILVAFTPAKGTGLWSTQHFFWKLIIREVRVQNPWSGGAGFERRGADRSNSAPLRLFFETPLHRSAPLHINF
jgi:hypothetical protein